MNDSIRKHVVIFQPSGRRGEVEDDKTIRQASRELGVEIETICGDRGTCGTCKVKIEEGFFQKYGVHSKMANLSPPTESEITGLYKDGKYIEKASLRLACQAHIHGDIVIFIPEESRTGKQVIRKSARDIAIKVKPAVKKYYVELKKATLEDTLGDWERLQKELGQEFGASNLTIDYKALLDLQETIRIGDWKTTVSVWMNKEVIDIKPGIIDKIYGLAIDIGTTTVAGYLCDLRHGKVIATESMMNPQITYGEDVMSRITYCMTNKNGLGLLNHAIIDGLNKLAGKVAAQAHIKRRDIIDVTIVGNTCMHHLFLNIDPSYIGRSPFPPSIHHSLDIKARDLGLKIASGAYVHMLPIEAGFVGADNVGVLIAETPYRNNSMNLIIDIGTNGELIMGNKERLLSCSCATGPAFEGAEIRFGMRAAPGAIEKIEIDKTTQEVRFKVIGSEGWNTDSPDMQVRGICGSGIVDVVPQMFMAGIIDHTGRFKNDLKTARLRVPDSGPEFIIAWAKETSIGQDIVICQDDVRNIQLAKAAMYAGAKIMMRHLGLDKVDRVILAGAFGSYIDRTSAAYLGIFPDCSLENIDVAGNAAGDGARVALLNIDKRKEADRVAREVEYIELTVEEDFDRLFTQAMWLPHMKDKFPHLEQPTPEKTTE